jgi:hypothetical protein
MTVDAGIHVFSITVAGSSKHDEIFFGYVYNLKGKVDMPSRIPCLFGTEKRCFECHTFNVNILTPDNLNGKHTVKAAG